MKKKYVVIAVSVLIIALIVAFGQIFTVRDISVVFHNKTGLTDEADILKVAGITYKKNIFNVKEGEIKQKIASNFTDRSIVVTNVVREFPDKVVIYVKERVPIFRMQTYSSEGTAYVATDKDFQRNAVQKEGENSVKLIEVTGYEVRETFDVKECIALREVAYALIGEGMSEEALPYFIEKINFSGDALEITLAETKAVLRVKMTTATADTAKLYKKYIATPAAERYGAIFDAEK